jgi:hypothetical protein
MRLQGATRPSRLRRALYGLMFAALATQFTGASAATRVEAQPAIRHLKAATVPLPEVRGLSAWLTGTLSRPQEPDSWALSLAGLTAIWAIGSRRMPQLGKRGLNPRRLHRE